jgi:serine/threonine protein kinase
MVRLRGHSLALSERKFTMPDAATCPTPQELAAFGLGKLPEHAAAAVAAHLQSCDLCRNAVAAVSADSFLGKVRAAGPDGSSCPPALARPATAATSAGRPAMPHAPCPDLPPELANHPKYLILRELGRGGMGVVYQARQTIMNRPVVIKVISRALLDQPGALERFHREVRAAAHLSHPNIVTAYDAEQAGELHMLVMEFVPGQSLAEVLQMKGPLPVASACHYMRQVALGLQHAHLRGMVHRDIKPGNLILMPRGQVKILDFGLAKVASEHGETKGLTASNAYMGTPDYCSPEQATDARNADIRADLYSLGCTLYCLLAGRPPFQEETAVKTILAHLQMEPRPLTELRPDVPERLWRVLARLLAKEPGRRYQKPAEVVQALAPFVKPGARPPDVQGDLAPTPAAASPVKGTAVAADTGQVQAILRERPGQMPARKTPEKDAVAVLLASPTEITTSPTHTTRAPEATEPTPGVRQTWLIGFGVAGGMLLLGLLLLGLIGVWAGVFKVKTKSGPPAMAKPAQAKSATESVAFRQPPLPLLVPKPAQAQPVAESPEPKPPTPTAGGSVPSTPAPSSAANLTPAAKPGETQPKPGGEFSPAARAAEGGAKGKPALTQRKKRGDRWQMMFNTANGGDYLGQLRGLGAILAIPVRETSSDREYRIVRDLGLRPVKLLEGDITNIMRIDFVDSNPSSVLGVMRALGLTIKPSHFVAFLPEELENKLAEMEKAAAGGRSEDDIQLTKFRIKRVGNRYEPELIGISFK